MLQKLENAYLAILRTVVIIASSLLLLGVVIFGLGSLKGFGDGPGDKVRPPKISADSVIEAIEIRNGLKTLPDADKEATPREDTADPNQQYYDSAAKAIVSFVIRVSNGAEKLDEKQVSEITKSRTKAYDSDELIAAYAKGFSETVAKVLADQKIENLAKDTSAIDVVNQLLNTFTEGFGAKMDAERERISTAQQKHIQAKAESGKNLYTAGACFGLFILIALLSIFMKIERNLRHLHSLSKNV